MITDLTTLTDEQLKNDCDNYIFELWQRNLFNVIITKEFFNDISLVFNQIRNPEIIAEQIGISDMVLAVNSEQQLCVVPLPTILDNLINEDDFFDYENEIDTRDLH